MDKKKQSEERDSIIKALNDLISGNRTFVVESVTSLSELFALVYSSMSQSFAAEIPDNILSLQKPHFDDQADKVLKITVSAGSIREHPISVTVVIQKSCDVQKGSYVKWSFCCDDSTIRFSVVLNVQGTQEIRMIEDAHRVKGDGRYDM